MRIHANTMLNTIGVGPFRRDMYCKDATKWDLWPLEMDQQAVHPTKSQIKPELHWRERKESKKERNSEWRKGRKEREGRNEEIQKWKGQKIQKKGTERKYKGRKFKTDNKIAKTRRPRWVCFFLQKFIKKHRKIGMSQDFCLEDQLQVWASPCLPNRGRHEHRSQWPATARRVRLRRVHQGEAENILAIGCVVL